MLISNVFINCKVKGKNFFTRKQLKVRLSMWDNLTNEDDLT